MLGIKTKWECSGCGSIINTENPFWTKKQRKDITEPTKCPCGKASGFKLLGFSECQFVVAQEQ